MCRISFGIFPSLSLHCLQHHISCENTLLCNDAVMFLPLWFAVVRPELCLGICIRVEFLSFLITSSLPGQQDGWAEVRLPSPAQGMSIKLGRSLSHHGATISRSAAAWLFCSTWARWNPKYCSRVSPPVLHRGRDFWIFSAEMSRSLWKCWDIFTSVGHFY